MLQNKEYPLKKLRQYKLSYKYVLFDYVLVYLFHAHHIFCLCSSISKDILFVKFICDNTRLRIDKAFSIFRPLHACPFICGDSLAPQI